MPSGLNASKRRGQHWSQQTPEEKAIALAELAKKHHLNGNTLERSRLIQAIRVTVSRRLAAKLIREISAAGGKTPAAAKTERGKFGLKS